MKTSLPKGIPSGQYFCSLKWQADAHKNIALLRNTLAGMPIGTFMLGKPHEKNIR